MIPASVRRAAAQLLADYPEHGQLLQRLRDDPSMPRVWRALEGCDGDPALLFHQVFTFAALGLRTVSTGERRAAMQPYLRRAQQLREDAAGLDLELAEPLGAAAAIYDELAAAAPPADDPVVVERQRAEPRLRGLVIALSLELSELYGATRPGLVATLANVALDRDDVTRDRVRMLAGRKPHS
jgi:hypothetical protein